MDDPVRNTLKNNSLRVKVPIKTSINRYLVVFHNDLLIFFVWYVSRISVYHTWILWIKENRKSSTNLNGLVSGWFRWRILRCTCHHCGTAAVPGDSMEET